MPLNKVTTTYHAEFVPAMKGAKELKTHYYKHSSNQAQSVRTFFSSRLPSILELSNMSKERIDSHKCTHRWKTQHTIESLLKALPPSNEYAFDLYIKTRIALTTHYDLIFEVNRVVGEE